MADITKDALRREITAILKDADLATTSAKKVRLQIEEKLDVNLTDRKQEIDDLVMECLEKKSDKGKDSAKKRAHDDDEEEEEEESEEQEDEEEEEPKQKRTAAAKKPTTKRTKRGSSDESEEESEDNASDEEYSPTGKKGKAGKKGKGKGKKKGSDSDDSDEDWNKSRRTNIASKKSTGGPAAGGAKRGGGGYTRPHTLSPELAAVVGQDSMARHEVVRKVWSIIKERNLYDPKNKQFAICDDELQKVFGVKRFRTFGMMKYLKNHFLE